MAERGRPRAFDRAAALRRAMEVFWERGYDGASLSDLTSAMAINAPSLYAAFGCKEALFREAVALYEDTEGAATTRALRDEPTARRAVEAMLRNNADAYTAPGRPTGCLVVLAATTCTPSSDGIRDHLAEHRRQVTDILAARLTRGIAEGDVPKGVDVDALAAFYTSVLQGLSIQARDGISRARLRSVVDCAMAAWPPAPATAPGAPRRRSGKPAS